MIYYKLTMCSDTYTYADLFKQPNMRKISLLSILQLMLIACIFDASIRNITNLRFVKLFNKALNEGSRRVHNHRENPYSSLLLCWLKAPTLSYTLYIMKSSQTFV